MDKLFKRLAQKYKTPKQVQQYLRKFEYNREESGITLRSAVEAIKRKKAHCYEAAFIAAAILEHNGYPPLVMSLESQDGLYHVLYIFQQKKKWGAVGQSRDPGLFGREPLFRSIKDLAWSYFDPYIDGTSKVTAYQVAHLDETRTNWRYSKRNVWQAEKYLLELPHHKLVSSKKRYKKILNNYLSKGSPTTGWGWW